MSGDPKKADLKNVSTGGVTDTKELPQIQQVTELAQIHPF
jgi:hypothetical protein